MVGEEERGLVHIEYVPLVMMRTREHRTCCHEKVKHLPLDDMGRAHCLVHPHAIIVQLGLRFFRLS